MILTAEQIKKIAKGVLEWEAGPEGGLIPQRFSSEQREIYRSNEARYLRTHATSGIRLECRTDAAALEISLRVFPGSAKDWYGLDLFADGRMTGHLEGTLDTGDHVQWAHPLPQGEKVVTLYLPCLMGVELLGVTLKSGTVCSAVEHSERILFMGDSITQGYTSHFPSITYPAQVAAHRKADYLNQGNGGEVFHPEILVPLDWNPTMAVIAYGTNDWATKNREWATRDAGDFLDRFAQVWPGLPTVVLTPIWRADCLTRREDDFKQEEMTDILRALAARHPQMKVVSGIELFPKIRELLEDVKVHPNELGFTIYAKRIAKAMDALYPQDEPAL